MDTGNGKEGEATQISRQKASKVLWNLIVGCPDPRPYQGYRDALSGHVSFIHGWAICHAVCRLMLRAQRELGVLRRTSCGGGGM